MPKEELMDPEQCYHLETTTIFSNLKTNENGLTNEEATLRQKEVGQNVIPDIPPPSRYIIFLRQFTDPLIYVLIFVAIISIFLSEFIDASVITLIILANAAIGYFQEIQSQNALNNLKSFLRLKTKVILNDEPYELDASELVPGDIVILDTGSKIPADIRVIETTDLRVNEAALTGESTPVTKIVEPLSKQTPLSDRKNMLYSGTFVTSGHGRGVVIATGLNTEFGKIASTTVEAAPPPSPLELQLKLLSKQILLLVSTTMLLLILIGVLRHLNFRDIFFTSVNLAVSAIPEGLPAVLTITLAIGVRKMAKKQAIVRHLAAVETLGAVTIIATDKTGTLTRDEMVIEKIFLAPDIIDVDGEGYSPDGNFYLNSQKIDPLSQHSLNHFLHTGILCNSASLVKEKTDWRIIGDPTEGSLIVVAAKAGLSALAVEEKFTKLDEIPFHTAKRFMATLHHEKNSANIISIKGATEEIINFCTSYSFHNRHHPLDAKARKYLLETNRTLSSQGYRVLALAFKEGHKDEKLSEKDLNGATFSGFCAMKDAPRPEVTPAISLAHNAGIRVAMITGDHALTAQNIANSLQITSNSDKDSSTAITGEELEQMSTKDFHQASKTHNVFARISPIDKLKLVKSFQDSGHLVAVTGDGINDAPALRQADIGIAMGKTGTDITREASDIILANDNFATIIKAIEEGRTIYQNIKRVVLFLLSTNVGEILIVLGALIAGATIMPNLPLPFEPIQLLWVNLLTDGAGTIPLALEPMHINTMSFPPRKLHDRLLDSLVKWRIILVSATMMVVALGLYIWEYQHSSPESARTVAFEIMVFTQLFNMFNCRSLTQSIFAQSILTNPYLIYSFITASGLSIIAAYLPPLQQIFYTSSLSINQWYRIIIDSLLVIVVVEIDKWFRQNYGQLSPKVLAQKNLEKTS